MGHTNIRLWKCLGITPTKTSFEYHVSGEQIYMFADVLHLLKLVRNHLVVLFTESNIHWKTNSSRSFWSKQRRFKLFLQSYRSPFKCSRITKTKCKIGSPGII
uniref:Transposable element P transposase n=1 Tax=Sipha flava TaxID=143950 RepID=A0A2S2QE51_9HEMI